MDPQLSLRRLEIFRLVVEERSVTRAAEVLLVAQPAVSAQLRALEGWVGAKLFARQGNRLVLTEAGERTERWAREVLAGAAQVRRDVGDLASGETGRVIIASSMAVGTYIVPPIMAEVGRQRPRADITVSISRPEEVVHAVESGECDMAVLNWDQRRLPENIASELLGSFSLSVYAAPGLVPDGARLSAAEALRLPLVGAPDTVVYQRNLVTQLRAAGHEEPRFLLRLGHAEAMKNAAVANGWALIAPAYAVRAELVAGALVELAVDDLQLEEHVTLIHRDDKHFSPLQSAAVAAIREGVTATAERDLLETHHE
ncbi:LysR family transcriptional regulator [Nocardioides sp. NBC_00163]|uniref:LysR family transcriptional regulator n=1 Tax=Nocardioides sp. NBC_00163 TaxID=2975999 RepID=UPI00324F6592